MPGLGGDRRLLARSRAIIECRHRTIGQRPLNAALDGLVMHTQSVSYSKERGVFPVGQQQPRPFDPARRLRSRPRYPNQPRRIFISDRQFNRLPPCCHDLQPRSCESEARVQAVMDHKALCPQCGGGGSPYNALSEGCSFRLSRSAASSLGSKEPRIVAFEQYGRGLEGPRAAQHISSPLVRPRAGASRRGPCEPSGAGRRRACRPVSNP